MANGMNLPRRQFCVMAANVMAANVMAASTVAGAVAGTMLPRPALAADYPVRPVKILEGFGGGGTPDLISRLIAQWLSEKLGQPFVVENRTGAGGNIATEAAIRSAPDGYTLLTCLSANAINATLYQHLNFDFLRDTTPVAGLVSLPLILLVNPSFPAQTLAEFIAYAKANPGKINMASPGIGTPMHVAGELLKLTSGVNIVHVPYRGPAPAFTDLLAGQIQAFIITVPAAFGFVKSGQLRALGVTSAKRVDVLPDVPTDRRSVAGFRGNGLGRYLRAQGHAGGDRRQAQRGDHCRPRRSADQGQDQGPRRRADADDAGRVRKIPHRRNREVGQGGQILRRQG